MSMLSKLRMCPRENCANIRNKENRIQGNAQGKFKDSFSPKTYFAYYKASLCEL